MTSWSELHGEENEGKVSDWLAGARDAAEKNRGRVFCKNCQDFIHRDEMKKWHKDDETTDLLCPDCDSVLVEDV